METEKKGPSDGSNYYQKGDDDEQSEEENKIKEKDELYRKELEELEEVGKQMKEREKEKLKRFKKRDIDAKNRIRKEKEINIGGQKVESQKDFLSTLKKNKGVFNHDSLKNFSASGGKKIENVLKRISGVSSKEKKEFYSGLKAYGMKKSILKKGELKEYYMGVKHKFRGFKGKAGFKNMEKNIGEDDLNNLKRIKRRSAEKMFDALSGTGKKKHQMKQSSNRNPGAGRPGSTSPSRIKNR